MAPTPTVTPDLPDQLRAARRDAGLSQAALAELADVSVGSIERWERGLLPKRRSRVLGIVWEALEQRLNDGGRPQQAPPVTTGRNEADRRGSG
jgi:predicted transcriptional regulator